MAIIATQSLRLFHASFQLSTGHFHYMNTKMITLIISLVKFIFPTQALGSWTQITYTNTVSGRFACAGAFMPNTNEYLVFGGQDGNTNRLNDLWSISLTSLQATRITATSPIGARYFMAYTTNPVSGDFYIHGGWIGGSAPNIAFNDLWVFNTNSREFTQLQTGPSRRAYHCMEYDSITSQIYLFGGSDVTNSVITNNEFWIYSIASNNWAQKSASGSWPAARSGHACTINPATGAFYIQGGSSTAYSPDLWSFTFSSGLWTLVNSGNADVSLTRHAMKYIASLNSVYVFMGSRPGSYSISIYQLSLSNANAGWTPARTANLAPFDSQYSTGFNPLTGEFFIFGGSNNAAASNKLWSLVIDTPSSLPSQSPPSTSNVLAGQSSSIDVALTESSIVRPPAPASSPPSVPLVISISSFSNNIADSQTDASEPVILITPISAKGTSSITTRRYSSTMFQTANANESPFSSSFWIIIIVTAVMIFLTFLGGGLCVYRTRQRKRQSMAAAQSEKNQSFPSGSTTSISSFSSHRNSDVSSYSKSNSSRTTTYSTTSVTHVSSEQGLAIPAYTQLDFTKDIRLRQILAQGGFGVAYLADVINTRLSFSNQTVVVKQLKKPNLTERDMQMFYQEVSLMEYFKRNQNVAKFFGYTVEPPCIIMKYYERGSLSNWIKKSKRRVKGHVLVFAHDISSGVMAMHQKGVVHNDLKPDNILLEIDKDMKAVCVITDFGISQVLTGQILKVRQFKATQINGLSFAYAAPDRIVHFRNKSEMNNIESVFTWDVYSVGVIIYELLVAKRPF